MSGADFQSARHGTKWVVARKLRSIPYPVLLSLRIIVARKLEICRGGESGMFFKVLHETCS